MVPTLWSRKVCSDSHVLWMWDQPCHLMRNCCSASLGRWAASKSLLGSPFSSTAYIVVVGPVASVSNQKVNKDYSPMKITLPSFLSGKVWCLLWIDQSVQPPQVKWMRFVATISFLKHLEVNTSRTGTSADKEIWEWRDRYLLSCPFASPEFFLLFRRCPVPAERRLPPPNLLRLDLPSPFRQPSLLCS